MFFSPRKILCIGRSHIFAGRKTVAPKRKENGCGFGERARRRLGERARGERARDNGSRGLGERARDESVNLRGLRTREKEETRLLRLLKTSDGHADFDAAAALVVLPSSASSIVPSSCHPSHSALRAARFVAIISVLFTPASLSPCCWLMSLPSSLL
jgi:hypothetical protein